MRIIFQQSTLDAMQKSRFFTRGAEYPVLKAASPQGGLNTAGKKDDKFLYFQKKIVEHIAELDGEEANEVKKSLFYMVDAIVKSKFPVGTIREWKGKKYIKIAPGKWRAKYDSNSRSAKLAVAALKRKAEQCKTSQELLQLVLENRDRFSDQDRKPLPFVQELSRYVSELNDRLETLPTGRTQKEHAEDLKALKKRNSKEYGKKRLKHIQEDLLLNNVSYKEKLLSMKEAEKKIESIKNETFTNVETGIKTTFSKRTPSKLISNAACIKSIDNGFSKEEHYTMATKIDDLFKNANLVAVEPDRDSDLNSNVKDIKRFAVEFDLNGSKGIALLIVKNTQNAGHKLYSVELAELIKKGSRKFAAVKENPNNTQPIENLSGSRIAYNAPGVNKKTRTLNTIDEVKEFNSEVKQRSPKTNLEKAKDLLQSSDSSYVIT